MIILKMKACLWQALIALALAGWGNGQAIVSRVEPVPATIKVIRNIQYCTGGGKPLFMDIYQASQGTRPVPAVLWIHGGGWLSGEKQQNHMAQLFASKGFIAAVIDYRLSGEALFPAAVEDCKCAVRYLRANAGKYGIDPSQIAVGGESAGAHLAMLTATAGREAKLEGDGGWPETSSNVQAVISYFGPTDLTAPHQYTHIDDMVKSFLGGVFRDEPDVYRRASPVHWVSKGDPPLLMVHGDQDQLVPLSQSREMYRAYKNAGLQVRFIIVAGADHDFKQVSRTISPSLPQIESATISFLRQYIRKAGNPSPPQQGSRSKTISSKKICAR